MKNKRWLVVGIVIVAMALGIVVACDDSAAGSNSQPVIDNKSKGVNSESANKGVTDKTTETSSEGAADDNQDDVTAKDSSGTESVESGSGDSQLAVSTKDEYLKKLNEMEEEDRHSAAGTTIAELEKQEEERYEKWDKELNEIYRVLEGQLSPEQMEKVREEQRSWVKQRDVAAKESSLKYKGGSHEALEYVATQAVLTRERCYVLVARYME
jgi:uncharacterized protein YecT (DUF1311 family)